MTKRRSRLGASVLLAFGLLVACGSATNDTIHVTSYDQSCTKDTDCVAVLTGTIGCCGGDCGAINKTAQAQYQAALASVTASVQCGDFSCPATDCSFFPAVCNAGKCALPKCAQGGADICPRDGGVVP
jgi:hypothetical protein